MGRPVIRPAGGPSHDSQKAASHETGARSVQKSRKTGLAVDYKLDNVALVSQSTGGGASMPATPLA